jgi:PKD repeat protein
LKKIIIGLVLVCLLVTSAACSSGQKAATPARATMAPTITAAPELRHSYGLDKPNPLGAVKSFFSDGESNGGPSMATAPAGSSGVAWTSASTPMSASDEALPERMVVRTGNIQMVVNEISSAMNGVGRVASAYNGYIVTSQKGQEGEKNVGSISIRIAAENFDRAMADLRNLAKSIIFESTSSQDVTEEYVDLDSKVTNLQSTETQLRKIMEGAEKTEDILSIQRELTNVRGNIEQAKGRMHYLERTSSSSLIQVQLEEAVLALKFTANKTNVDINEDIRFTSDVAGGFPPYSYQWDFGDGSTSNEVSPSHSYRDAGMYFVSLKVSDDKGYTNTLSRNPYINVKASWKAGNVASSAWNGFKAFGRVVVNILIWLGIFSPVWIVIGGIIWLVTWRRKRRKS